jgi:signal transduction histidine kinase/FixJ family two-component response regulator
MLLLDQLVGNIAESTRADTKRMEREMARIVNGLILLSAVCLLVAIALVGYFILDRRRYERQLARAIERADQANRAKSRFLAHMSHEIRTPMNGIVAAIDLLKESDLSSQGNEALEVMETSSESLTAIVNDILDLSKIEAGRINLRCEPLELNGFLRILEKSVLPVAQNKGLELVFDWPREQNLVIESDPVRLRQILLNLLSNAIKFTESGRVSLKAVCEESETRARIAFEITDTGIGIPPEKQDLLFKAFSQVDNSLTRQHQGTGLGLVISKALVQSMKGRIAFHSKVGIGTTFTVTLSFPRLARRAEPEASPGDILYFSGKPLLERVLLVDDVKSNLLVTSRLLQKLNIPADLAESGPEAIRLARQTRYGLILMDCQMPGMDGYEAAGHIRHEAHSRGQPVVIVALLAHAMDEHRRESENQGMDDHLGKPLRLKTLESCLLQFFRLPDRNENAQPQHQKPSGPRFQDSTASGGRQLTMSL